jgi:hypothetical protein
MADGVVLMVSDGPDGETQAGDAAKRDVAE